ncbi:aminotransferase class I/II-fold pyridoxal phosphate-dependent enzyme [Arundinibacter roseus]|uniref:Aminotransferase class I/II-fold pyridoxal phosphate-dependent enzyme n=1 Tax=Arundinibacter roseus TaxID=2070510 RepID=A0A4R4JY32_9BACT|nr:aminotransferase class I/II-fold pyridoxal phosphate-dependent enzyme [Arundinibacter roseus]TDB59827.1 aminotransferase class I/II-fold pyridoxal phosphate-dependent enzyme [Arundinibacter roseus]
MNEPFLTYSLPGRTVSTQSGEEHLWFSGTDYLSMGHHETFQQHLFEGFNRYGTHYGSSRNNSLRLAIYEEAEAALAAFVGAPGALATSSGMWAGQLVMKFLDQPATHFHYAPGVHPALWGRDYHPQLDSWKSWFDRTLQIIGESAPETRHVLCTDSIGSPWVVTFPLELLHSLPEDANLWLIVDDSHGLGVLGTEGRGIFSQLPKKDKLHVLVTSSLNKAMGIPAGIIFGEPDTLSELRKMPWFAGSSPAAPAYLYALKQNISTQLYQKTNAILQANIQHFFETLTVGEHFTHAKKYPAFCSRDADLYLYLYKNGILTSCFSYPNPTDPAVTRLIVSAAHQKTDLDRVAEVCEEYFMKK